MNAPRGYGVLWRKRQEIKERRKDWQKERWDKGKTKKKWLLCPWNWRDEIKKEMQAIASIERSTFYYSNSNITESSMSRPIAPSLQKPINCNSRANFNSRLGSVSADQSGKVNRSLSPHFTSNSKALSPRTGWNSFWADLSRFHPIQL